MGKRPRLVVAIQAYLLVGAPNSAFCFSAQPRQNSMLSTNSEIFSRSELKLTWEPEVATEIREKASKSNHDGPFVVGIVGIPGSGKTTGANLLQDILGSDSLVIPMDGYHYSMATLKSFPNPDDCIYRRGAPDTFDAGALASDLQHLRSNATCWFPGFDHGVGDPEPKQYCFDPSHHKLCIVEGLYLLHDRDGWEAMQNKQLLDYTIFVDADLEECMERVKIRNQKIPGYTADEIAVRVEAVDRVNAMTVQESKPRANRVVCPPSVTPM